MNKDEKIDMKKVNSIIQEAYLIIKRQKRGYISTKTQAVKEIANKIEEILKDDN